MRNLTITLFFIIFGLLLDSCTLFKSSTKDVGSGNLYVDVTTLQQSSANSRDAKQMFYMGINVRSISNVDDFFVYDEVGVTTFAQPLEEGEYEIDIITGWLVFNKKRINTQYGTEQITEALYPEPSVKTTCRFSVVRDKFTILEVNPLNGCSLIKPIDKEYGTLYFDSQILQQNRGIRPHMPPDFYTNVTLEFYINVKGRLKDNPNLTFSYTELDNTFSATPLQAGIYEININAGWKEVKQDSNMSSVVTKDIYYNQIINSTCIVNVSKDKRTTFVVQKETSRPEWAHICKKNDPVILLEN